MNSKKKFSAMLVITMGMTVGTLMPQLAQAGDADMGRRGVEGSVSCGGNHFNRNGGTETQRSTFVLRNLSDDGAILLKRVRVYNAGGAMIFDSSVSGMPAFTNNVLSNTDTTLDAHQSAQLNIADFIPTQGRDNRPLQTVFDWSAEEPTLSLDVTHIRSASDFDPATGAVGKQYSRAHSACRTTSLKPFNYYR